MSLLTDNSGPSTSESEEGKAVDTSALLVWLQSKIADAEKALKIREDMAVTWRSGTNAEWVAAGAMHPSTAGKTLCKADRIKEAQKHDRIASKFRHELAMFRAVSAALRVSTTP